jgi:hypothetical protein
MKSQIRPRVLVPVLIAALALGGVAVWKLRGSSSDPAGEQPVAAESVSADAAAPPGDASSSPPQGVAAGWAGEANAICGQVLDTLRTQAPVASTDFTAAARSYEATISAAVSELRALEPAPAQVAGVTALLGLYDRQLTLVREQITAFEAGKLKRVQKLDRENVALEQEADDLATELGATTCAEDVDPADPDAGKAVSLGELKLAKALLEHDVVVVVLYAPRADVDTAVVREARAAATETGAAFVALDGTREADGAVLARTWNLRDTPATVVLGPGPSLVAAITGYADRETIGQAATDAGTRAPS